MLMELVGCEDHIMLNVVTALTAAKILHRKLVQSNQKSKYIKQIKSTSWPDHTLYIHLVLGAILL